MKKTLLTLGALVASVAGASAQGLVAGWDFADLGGGGLSTSVNGFAAEVTNSDNNGVATSGSISTSLTQGSVVSFASNGSAASGVQFSDGFDTTTSDLFGGGATGQQSLNILSSPSASYNAFTVNFTASTDVVLNFDWLTATTAAPTDFLNISYSTDGSNFTTFDYPGSTGYGAFGATSAWGKTTDTAFYSFIGQSDAIVDLSGVIDPIQAIRFEVDGVAVTERVAFDNIHVSGTAVVPEPSAFAAIFGAVALAFVASRRRK